MELEKGEEVDAKSSWPFFGENFQHSQYLPKCKLADSIIKSLRHFATFFGINSQIADIFLLWFSSDFCEKGYRRGAK